MERRVLWFCLLLLFLHTSGSPLNLLPKDILKKSGSSNRKVSTSAARSLADLLVSRNLSLALNLRQDPKTEGPIISVFARPHRRVLELWSDGIKGQMRVSFRGIGGMAYASVPINMADGHWHRVILEIQNDRVRLFLNCKRILEDTYPEMYLDDLRGDLSRPEVWVGQRSSFGHFFRGSFKAVEAEAGEVGPDRCSTITNHQFKVEEEEKKPPAKKMAKDIDYLKHRVGYLETEFKRWRDTVETYETELRHVQLHQRTCQTGNTSLEDGERILNATNCTECTCNHGQMVCHPVGCPALSCAHPLKKDEDCCPVCGSDCYYQKNYVVHGHSFWPKKCQECLCSNGALRCKHHSLSNCSSLPCPEEKQVTLENQCCPVCEDFDHCAYANPCHPEAECSNQEHAAACKCKEGFFGNGFQCYDINECLWDEDARQQLGGCSLGTICINTPGSFHCDCLPGYKRIDERTCLDIAMI